jgi:hypothetical protein
VADRRALIFAYYFPPHGGGGVQRTLKYVKYLPGEGFRSTVVTSSEHAYPLRDPHLMREIRESRLQGEGEQWACGPSGTRGGRR